MRVLIGWIALAGFVAAQTFQGSLRGRLIDETGAAVPTVKVSLVEATGVSRATLASAEGEFLFNSVEPATYSIVAQAPGFKTLDRKGIVVATQSAVTPDLTRRSAPSLRAST